jgi:hypothetical protein
MLLGQIKKYFYAYSFNSANYHFLIAKSISNKFFVVWLDEQLPKNSENQYPVGNFEFIVRSNSG